MALDEETPLPPFEAPREEYARFNAYFRSFNTGNKEGDLILTLGVPVEAKYEAFPFTDLQGEMVEIVVMKKVRRRRNRMPTSEELGSD